MRAATIILAIAPFCLLAGVAGAAPPTSPMRAYEEKRGGASRPLMPPVGRASRLAPGSIFDNPGFESLDVSNQPLHWSAVRQPEIRSEGGNHFAHVSSANYYFATDSFTFPVSAFQTVSLGARVRGMTGDELPMIYWELVNPDSGEQRFRGVLAQTTAETWTPMYASFTRLPNETQAGFLIGARADVTWVDFDDFFMVTEGIADGNFDDDDSWQLNGGAHIDSVSPGDLRLFLPAGASASQLVAHSPFAVEYFIRAYSDQPITIREERLASDGATVAVEEETILPDPISAQVLLGPIPQSGEGEIARVSIVNSGASQALVDNVSRGWVCASPKIFEPVSNSACPTIRFAAAWPDEGNVASWQIAILDQNSTEVDRITSLQQDGSTGWVDYDGGSLPAGTYTARFELAALHNPALMPTQTFELRRGNAWPTRLDDFSQTDFERVAWIWLYHPVNSPDGATVEETRAKLQQAKDDGFNLLWISARTDQYQLIKDAADANGVPYILAPIDVRGYFDRPQGNDAFDPIGIRDALLPLQNFGSDPLCRGLYLKDEPNVGGVHSVSRLTAVARLMQRDGGWPPVVTFLSSGAPLAGADFPFLCTYYYPFGAEAKLPRTALDAITPRIESDVQTAIAQNRNYWMGAQGYALQDFVPVMRGAECRAQLGIGLALGMKGYFVFMYNTLNSLAGLRTQSYDGTERLAAFNDFNLRTSALNDLLMALPTARTAPPQTNLLARVAQGTSGNYYAFVVNTDPDADLSFTATTDTATTMMNVETSAITASGTSHGASLDGGQWAIYVFSGGALPTNFTGTLTPHSFSSTVNPQIIGSITPSAPVGTLGLRPDNTALATTEGTRHRVYSLTTNNFGAILFDEDHLAVEGASRYIDNQRLVLGSRWLGARVYTHANNSLSLIQSKLKETGTGVDYAGAADSFWLAQSYWGVEHDADADTSHIFAPYDDFRSVLEVSDDHQSVIATESVGGLHLLTLGGENGAEIQAEALDPQGQYYIPSWIEKRRLASGNLDRKLSVYNLTNDGHIAEKFILDDPQLVQAEATAWLDPQTLAVADARFGVRFYRVAENGAWTALGVWLPAERPFHIKAIDATRDGRLAVSLLPAQVIIADVTAALGLAESDAWIMK